MPNLLGIRLISHRLRVQAYRLNWVPLDSYYSFQMLEFTEKTCFYSLMDFLVVVNV